MLLHALIALNNKIDSGTASNSGQEVTNYGSQGTNYDNEAAKHNTVEGLVNQYSLATMTPSYGSCYDDTPFTSRQSSIVGGSQNEFFNSSATESSDVGGFNILGVTES